MIWVGPTVKIGGLLIQDDPKWIDQLTYDTAYKRGYREPRYPVPAHQYITLIRDISVEMVIGVTKTYVDGEVYIDCECVLYIVNEELINEISSNRRK